MRVLLVAILLTGAAATDCVDFPCKCGEPPKDGECTPTAVPTAAPAAAETYSYNFETMQPTLSPTPQTTPP